MLDLCGSIIRDALIEEVTTTINEKMNGKFTDKHIKQNITYFLDREYHRMNASILTIGIIVSYDMGCQKRATGNIYSSLTGHGFYIGCLIKKWLITV